MEKVIVFGVGQTAEITYSFLTHDSPYEVVGFTADRAYLQKNELLGLPLVAFDDIERIFPPDEYQLSIPISYRNMNKLRAEKYYQAKHKGYSLISYISPRAMVWPGLVVGDNCYILENSIINPYTSIGNNVFIGPGCNLGHHIDIKDHCFIGPSAVILGSTTIEPYCLIGANSTIKDGGITVGREAVVGMGSVITKDIAERQVYLGNPAKLHVVPSNELKLV